MRSVTVTPEMWLAASPARQRLLAWWSVLRALPSRRQVLLVDTPGALVETLARERGYDCLRLTSATLLERYGVWVEPWFAAYDVDMQALAPTQQPARLAARTGWREYRPPLQPALPFSPPRPLRLRQETLTSLMRGLARVGLIWVNDPDHLEGILQGGMPALLTAQPVLGMLLPGAPDAGLRQQLQALADGGYRLLDIAFQPLDAAAELPRECIALPAAAAHLATACRDWVMELATFSTASHEYGFAEQRLLGKLSAEPPLVRAAIGSGALPFALGDLLAEHWHAGERHGDQHWRWSGGEADGRLLLPLPAPGHYTLVLRVMNVSDPYLSGKGQLFLDGQLQRGVGERLRQGGWLEHPFSIEPQDWTGALELRLSLPYTTRPNPDDPRWLGISLDRLELKWSLPRWN